MYPRPYGHYHLLERLGTGGMSEVDLARRTVEEAGFVRFVVIKRIKTDRSTDPSFVRMFKDEARITAELHHAHIGQVYDFGRHEDEWYLALEYVPGVDVRYLVNALRERQQRVPIRVALRILCDTLDALDYAHNKADTLGRPMRIVHRDVNPRNIMVSIRGDVKLIDFGVAKATDRLERTRTDHIKGKFAYMAPEQITGNAVDHRADLYAVGLCLHELLSGVSPFFGLNQMQIMHRMMSAKIPQMPPVPELPDADELKRIHDRALSGKPEDRYQDARAFREDLDAVASHVGGLPSREQISRFLAQIDPELVDRLQRKMEGYALLDMSSSGPTDLLEERHPDLMARSGPDLSGARERSRSGLRRGDRSGPDRGADLPVDATIADQTGSSLSRTEVFAGGLVLASVGSGLLGAIGAATLTIGVLVWWYGADGGGAEPGVTSAHEAPARVDDGSAAPSDAEVPSEPQTAPAPTAIPAPAPGLTPAPPSTVAPAPTPAPPSTVAPVPTPAPPSTVAPVPTPSSVSAPAPTPSEAPVPTTSSVSTPAPTMPSAHAQEPVSVASPAAVATQPVPTVFGTLKVAAAPGLAVFLDGQKTERVTPVEMTLPAGTYRVQVEGFPEQTVTLKPGLPVFAKFR